MKINEWLNQAQIKLDQAGLDTARLDALVLLCDVVEHDKAWVLAHSESVLTTAQLHTLNEQLQRREAHEPLAYIRGHAEFYGRDFLVDERVLVPRPESECIINVFKKYATLTSVIVDVGTGSGALAITAKLELPSAQVIATDIDKGCLEVAQQNTAKLGADITFYAGDLLEPLLDNNAPLPDMLLCNLPYVPEKRDINKAASHEPRQAIFSGTDGLQHYRELCKQLTQLATKPRYVITEVMEPEHHALTDLFDKTGYEQRDEDGLVQCFEVRKRS